MGNKRNRNRDRSVDNDRKERCEQYHRRRVLMGFVNRHEERKAKKVNRNG